MMTTENRRTAGVIGLGIIGSRVAASLRAAGFRVPVWSRSPRPEPGFVGSAAAVASAAEIVQLFVSDGAAVCACIDAMAGALTPSHVVLCHATIGREATLEAARRVEKAGAAFVDAPFTGSRNAAAQGALTYYLGGDPAVLDRVEPVLRASSRALLRVGAAGDAALLKVATNMITAVTGGVLAEAVALVRRSGMDPALLGAALEHNAIRSVFTDMKLPNMLEDRYEPHFALRHMLKDVRLAGAAAAAVGLDIPATATAGAVMAEASERGWDAEDFTVIARLRGDGA